MKTSEGEGTRGWAQRAVEAARRSGFGEGAVSLAGRTGFKSHRQNGQRVATEYTMWLNPMHCVLRQALILHLQAARGINSKMGRGSDPHTSTQSEGQSNVFSTTTY